MKYIYQWKDENGKIYRTEVRNEPTSFGFARQMNEKETEEFYKGLKGIILSGSFPLVYEEFKPEQELL